MQIDECNDVVDFLWGCTVALQRIEGHRFFFGHTSCDPLLGSETSADPDG